jgi:prophage regulatory protein
MTDNRLIAMKQVLHLVSLSKSEVYRRIKAGTFPKQVRLGPSRVAFVHAEIQAWMDSQLSSRAAGGEVANA